MTGKDTDSMATVQIKPDYAASEVYSTASEAPPLEKEFRKFYQQEQSGLPGVGVQYLLAKLSGFSIHTIGYKFLQLPFLSDAEYVVEDP
ncbi:unnamed protein product [Ceratitis capitata]|uniref:(Mediterranean fruit fly) hypothetical protein n=1 Tax=Ceratitis capitata TaxID=7213 RepID=A0A811UV39_CERCA|nr:unnamed protein product [Ceratitis capitata]